MGGSATKHLSYALPAVLGASEEAGSTIGYLTSIVFEGSS